MIRLGMFPRRCLLVLVCAIWGRAANAQTSTELLHSGSAGAKKDLVIIGDGFTAAQQGRYNALVEAFVMQGVFREDVYLEDANAFNIHRVNITSVDSGVTQVDSVGMITTARNTALDYHFSGRWNRCWMEYGPNTAARIAAALTATVPGWDYVFVILNEPGFGGCGGGNGLTVTSSVGATVGLHEMGHMVGGLCDEYVNDTLTYPASLGEPGCVNMTINTNRATIKWRDFINPSTNLPTSCGGSISTAGDAGAFLGGNGSFPLGVWRETCSDRMNSNSPPFGPVDYDHMQNVLDPFHEYDYLRSATGDFDGDGRADVLVHNANSIAVYRSGGTQLGVRWVFTGKWGIWDDVMPGDRFYVGDFNGDGKDDIVVVNMTDWSMPYLALCLSDGTALNCVRRFDRQLPGWGDMRANDEFMVGDYDGDGKDDLYVFNGRDWSMSYLLMLRSTGSDLVFTRRFDDTLPGWGSMLANDRFFVADQNNDRRDDLYVFNGDDWSIAYLEMLRSTGNNLSFVKRFDDQLPGWGRMLRNDRFFPADFDGDGRKDLYVFNGRDWSMPYLEMLRSTGSDLAFVRRFDATIPGWDGMAPNDQFFVADVNGDRKQDLYIYNAADWSTEYLGTIKSSGSNLSGSWQEDWIGSWNLGAPDLFLVGNFSGGSGWDDLFVRNASWFGLLHSHGSSVGLDALHPKWIHDHAFHRLGWW